MIKKVVSKLLFIIIILALAYSSFFQLPTVEAAQNYTLGYYEQKLAQAKKEAQDNNNAINKTENEISSSKNQIERLKKETLALVDEVNKLTEEIEKYEGHIKDKLKESKGILEYMQVTSGHNVYLDYVFKADSITDLINRNYAIKEIIAYNEKVIAEMEQLIEDNTKRQDEIEKRKVKISNTESQLEKNIVSLGAKKESLEAGGVDIEKEIKIYQEQVNMYKKLGCKTNDVIGVDCAVVGGTGIFRRPTTTGYITQEQYHVSDSKQHRAVDIGSKNGKKEKIYPIADGIITAIYSDTYGALTVAIEHYNINDKKHYTSLYVHLSSYAPGIKVGQKITSNEYIGYMGNTGYSFGTHLHLEVYPCRLYNSSDSNCYHWKDYVKYAYRLIDKGYKIRNLITFPKGTYNSWSSR